MFIVGWYEMIVLPLIFRMRWTDRISKTRRRLSTYWCQNEEKNRDVMRNRLEYKIRGACVSIFCVPNNVDGASFRESVDWLATNWIASWSDMECKNVRVIVISTRTSKIRSSDPAPKIRTHGRQFFLVFLLGIVTESNSRTRTKRMVLC